MHLLFLDEVVLDETVFCLLSRVLHTGAPSLQTPQQERWRGGRGEEGGRGEGEDGGG